jgi:hypothetical protein
MTRKGPRAQSQPVVERLLEQRRQYQDWLVRLDAEAATAAPSHVAARVREDYAARLEAVTAEIKEHEEAVRQALTEVTERAEELSRERTARNDELAEARLRRQVGEFDELRYEEVSGRCKAILGELAKDISAAERDVERYEEILGLIAGPPAPPEPPAARVAPAAAAPAPAPAAAAPPAAPREPRVSQPQVKVTDELAFLRSLVAGGESKPTGTPPAGTPPVPPAPAPSPAPRVSSPGMQIPRMVAPGPAAPDALAAKQRRPPEGSREADEHAKTLKCPECGTLNSPTEWYCEKCGAELSSF